MVAGSTNTTPFCGSCGWDVNNGVYGDKNLDVLCDSCGAGLIRFGFGDGTATAGAPGSFDGTVPADFDGLLTVTPNPATAWLVGESVTLGDGSSAYWDGSAWQIGIAP